MTFQRGHSHYKYRRKNYRSLSIVFLLASFSIHPLLLLLRSSSRVYGGKGRILPLLFDLFSDHRYVRKELDLSGLISMGWNSIQVLNPWRGCSGEGFITSPSSLPPSPVRFSSIKALRFRGLVCWHRQHWQDSSQFLESPLWNHLSRQAGRPFLWWPCLDWLHRFVPSSSSSSLSHDDCFRFFFHFLNLSKEVVVYFNFEGVVVGSFRKVNFLFWIVWSFFCQYKMHYWALTF